MSRIRAVRTSQGWTQAELAERSGVTRQLLSAAESGRQQPSVAAALRIAGALGVTVEELFAPIGSSVEWIHGESEPMGGAVATARVGDRVVAAPLRHVGADAEQWGVADAYVDDGAMSWFSGADSGGLVVAGCDPVLGLAARLVERTSRHRVMVVHCSTERSVAALAAGRVHAALVHGPRAALPRPGVDVDRWHVCRWNAGLAFPAGSGTLSVEDLVRGRHQVIQRDAGAGTQRAFERALATLGAPANVPGPLAEGHLDVARRLVAGGARAGVTMEAAAVAFGLDFVSLEAHTVELWVDRRWVELPALTAMLETISSSGFTDRVAAIGGYETADAGVNRTPTPSERQRTAPP